MSGRRERLAELRKQVGHTQETLAAVLEVHRRTVLRWEDGSVDPHPGQRKRLATALGVSMDELTEVLRAGPEASGDRDPHAEVDESAAVVPPTVDVDVEDVAGSRWPRWTRRNTLLTSLAVVGGFVVAAGIFLLRSPGDSPAPAAGAEVSTPLLALHSGRCVTVTGEVTADGAKGHQHACTGEPDQRWHLERVREGPAEPAVYRIVGVGSGRCLTPSEERFGGAPVIVQQTCDPAADAQEWRFIIEEQRNAFSYGQFINMARSSCLDINGGSVDVGTPVVLWVCGEQRNQRFGVANEAVSPPP